MDRDALARASRRRQALDALAFERDRETLLLEQLEDTAAEVRGEPLDNEIYAQLATDESELVRGALGQLEQADWEDDDEDATDEELVVVEDEEAVDENELELVRLQAEIESSRRSQAALERYLELLDD